MRLIRDVSVASAKSQWGRAPVLVAGAIFKIWPAWLYKEYFEGIDTELDALAPADDAILNGETLPRSSQTLAAFHRRFGSLPNTAYRLHTENFATATAVHLYRMARPNFLSQPDTKCTPQMTLGDSIVLNTVGDRIGGRNGASGTR